MSEKQKHPFKKGKIRHWGRDVSKRWYVEYQVYNVQTESLERRKKYGGINHYNTIDERMTAARNLKAAIDAELEKGGTIGSVKTRNRELKDQTITDALQFAFDIKKQHTRETNWKYYKTIMKVFPVWLEKNGYKRFKISSLRPDIMHDYFDHLTETVINSNKTFNNYLTYFNALFRIIQKRDRSIFPYEIPTHGLEFREYETNKHHAYTKDQLRKVKKECGELGFIDLWHFIQFIYYTLARPNEIRQLQVKHIELSEDRIYIPGDIAKGKAGGYVDIYGPFRQVLEERNLNDYPSDYYIFSTDGKPGDTILYDRYFWKQHAKVLKSTRLDQLSRKFDLYAYKHSGTINLYMSGVDLLDIQRQCRHKSPEQTMKYLRELDLFRKKDHLDKVEGI